MEAAMDVDDSRSEATSHDSSDGDEAPVQWLATGREKRSTAGNRLASLLQQEDPDDELELLFAEDGEDEGFDDVGSAQSDVQMDSSSDEEDQGPAAADDDLEGERELQKEARAEKRAKKLKGGDGVPKMPKKRVQIDPTALPTQDTPPRPKKVLQYNSRASRVGDAPTRASSRGTTRQSKEQLDVQIKRREIKRVKQLANMEKAAAAKEAAKKPKMTQADRLAQAARVEKKNNKSLSSWEQAEQQREAEQRAKLAALSNRRLEGPVITWWSGMAEWEGDRLRKVGKLVVVDEPKEQKQPRKRKHAEMVEGDFDPMRAQQGGQPNGPSQSRKDEAEHRVSGARPEHTSSATLALEPVESQAQSKTKTGSEPVISETALETSTLEPAVSKMRPEKPRTEMDAEKSTTEKVVSEMDPEKSTTVPEAQTPVERTSPAADQAPQKASDAEPDPMEGAVGAPDSASKSPDPAAQDTESAAAETEPMQIDHEDTQEKDTEAQSKVSPPVPPTEKSNAPALNEMTEESKAASPVKVVEELKTSTPVEMAEKTTVSSPNHSDSGSKAPGKSAAPEMEAEAGSEAEVEANMKIETDIGTTTLPEPPQLNISNRPPNTPSPPSNKTPPSNKAFPPHPPYILAPPAGLPPGGLPQIFHPPNLAHGVHPLSSAALGYGPGTGPSHSPYTSLTRPQSSLKSIGQPNFQLTTQAHLQTSPKPNILPHGTTLTPAEANPEPAAPPVISHSTRNCVILSSFTESALRSKDLTAQILGFTTAPPPPPPTTRRTAYHAHTNTLRSGSKPFSSSTRQPRMSAAAAANAANAAPLEPCAITAYPARYRDPLTGLAYYNAYAYREIQRLRAGEYKWSDLVGCFVGQGGFAARGVPDAFLGAGGRKR